MLKFCTTQSDQLDYFINYFETKNVDIDAYLIQNSLPNKNVIQYKKVPISTPLIYEMFEDIGNNENLKGFGWEAGMNANLNGLSNLGLLAIKESTLENILKSLIHNSQLGSSHASFFMIDHKKYIQFCHKGGLNKPSLGYLELELYFLSFFQNLIKTVTGESFIIDAATIRSKATTSIPINQVDDNHSYFSFVIPKCLLKLPNRLLKKASDLKKHDNIDIRFSLKKHTKDPVLGLKSILMAYDISEFPTPETVARMAQCSLRTLQRNLLKHNSSYLKIIQDLKMTHALNLLNNRELTIDDVSRSLNYKNVSHFSRAFKKHYKSPPSQSRLKVWLSDQLIDPV